MSASDYLLQRCRQWAEQTQESYRCSEHQEPNPFCSCTDATGQRVNGQIRWDGQWQERGAAITSARRRYHTWADQQRPEVQSRRQQFKKVVQTKVEEARRFKEWRLHWEAAGFVIVSQHKGRK